MIAILFPSTAPYATKKTSFEESCGSITIQRLEIAKGPKQFALFSILVAKPERYYTRKI